MSRGRAWSRKDTTLLREMVAECLPGPVIAERLGRTRTAVHVRSSKLGIRRPSGDRRHVDHDRFLELRERSFSVAACGRILRITPYMARRLELERRADNEERKEA